MQPGTMGVMSYSAGATWHRQRSLLALGGETLVSEPLGGMIWMDGHRCLRCRTLVLAY